MCPQLLKLGWAPGDPCAQVQSTLCSHKQYPQGSAFERSSHHTQPRLLQHRVCQPMQGSCQPKGQGIGSIDTAPQGSHLRGLCAATDVCASTGRRGRRRLGGRLNEQRLHLIHWLPFGPGASLLPVRQPYTNDARYAGTLLAARSELPRQTPGRQALGAAHVLLHASAAPYSCTAH
jgi:hypothetical protein